jgi:Protein of unknown function (DUF2510)
VNTTKPQLESRLHGHAPTGRENLAAPTNFDTTRIRFGEMIAAVSGIVLFISLFLEWYTVKGKGLAAGAGSQGVSGWESLSFIDILLFLIALIAIAAAVLRAMNSMPRQLPAAPSFIVLVAGAIGTLLVLFRILSTGDLGHPEVSAFIDVSRSYGIFVSFLAAAGITVGGWLAWNEEGKPMPGGRGAGAGAPGGAPLGAGQPPYGAGQPQASAPPQQQAYAQPAGGAAPAAQQPAAAAPAASAQPDAPAGAKADWYPDPRGEKRLRYWDGSQWTDHTAD